MDAVTKFSLESIAIKYGKEKLKIFVLAVVWRRREQEELSRVLRENPPETKALRCLDLAAEVGRGHFVGLVDDHQIPIHAFELRLEVFVAAKLVQATKTKIM